MTRAALRIAIAAILAIGVAFPALASWRDDMKVLRVGFLAGDNPSQEIARLEPFRSQLQYGLSVPVELFPARSYQALIEAEASGRVQYAILSSLAFVALDQACHCAEPLVQPTAANAARGFRALLVSRSDGPIATLADAKGARIAVGRKYSLSGRLVPFAGLAEAGIEPSAYFASVIERRDGLDALQALEAGETDLAVTWSMADDPLSTETGSGPIADLAARDGVSAPGLHLVWQSALVPFGPHAVRTDLPPQARSSILSTLLEMQSVNPTAYDAVETQLSGGFVEADPRLYRSFAAVIAEGSNPQ